MRYNISKTSIRSSGQFALLVSVSSQPVINNNNIKRLFSTHTMFLLVEHYCSVSACSEIVSDTNTIDAAGVFRFV